MSDTDDAEQLPRTVKRALDYFDIADEADRKIETGGEDSRLVDRLSSVSRFMRMGAPSMARKIVASAFDVAADNLCYGVWHAERAYGHAMFKLRISSAIRALEAFEKAKNVTVMCEPLGDGDHPKMRLSDVLKQQNRWSGMNYAFIDNARRSVQVKNFG